MPTYSDDDGLTGPGAPTGAPVEVPPSDEHPTVVTAYGELPAYSSADVLPPETGRRARRAAAEQPIAGGPSPLGRFLLPFALVLVSSVALLAGWNHFQDKQSDLAPPHTAAATHAPTPGTSHAAAAPTKAEPTSEVTSQPTAAATTTPTTKAAATAVDRSVQVTVLNATQRVGLAARVAAKLHADGWTVVHVGNWTRGGVTETTAFLVGHPDAAATLKKDLPAVGVVKPPLSGLSDHRITLVIGKDYPTG
jgi:LytR cell envelope-related transcriptional attenuator